MDKVLIQKKTMELLEKAGKQKEFTIRLQNLLKSYVDTEATKNYKRIIPNTGKYYGVPKPVLWVIASEIDKFIQREPEKAEGLLEDIWAESSYEAKQITGKSLEKFGQKNPKICLDFVASVLTDIDNWSVCDSLAMYAIEPIVYSNPALVLPLSEKWIKSQNKWIKRFSVVTLRGYKRVKVSNRVFMILDTVMQDKEKDIKKAISWILREITKKNPEEVASFLTKWAKANSSKDTIWIITDGMKKLNQDDQKKIFQEIIK
ncbi:MAG: DNA alkylation repair protein [Candidatus Cloacimonetes bacterium]|nr:DNA alkylation repair protein [Candidatus Cloacimonadota bacterium]